MMGVVMGFDLEKWILKKKEGEPILSYVGDISPEKITEILSGIEQNISLEKEKQKTRKTIYNVFVECIQNLFHHVDPAPPITNIDPTIRFGIILLVRDKTFYRISTGNFVKLDKISVIKNRIEQVNLLTDEEIRMLYREVLDKDGLTTKGGGRLGMLNIVRKTGNKLEYMLYPFDEEHVFFSLDVYIS